jgi:DNA-binding cell septation regulator SpoVG
MPLPVLDARVRLFNDNPERPTQLLAFAELTIAEAFVIKGIRVLRRREEPHEPFVVFPAEKGKGAAADRWYDIAHPTSTEARAAATTVILTRYQAEATAAGR